MTKFDAEYAGFNPCITCWDEPAEPDLETALDCHRLALRAWGAFLRDVSVLSDPVPLMLGCGTSATLSVWRFAFEHDSGRSWITNARTILVYRKDRIHTFQFMDGLSSETTAGDELKATAQSLSYSAPAG